MWRRWLRPNSGEPAALPAGEVVGLDHMLTSGTGVAEVGGGEVAGVGARRGPAAAAAAGGVAGKEGSRLANKRRLCLTCELGEALGVSAGDEKLGKKEARSSGGHGGGSGNGIAREGEWP
jgi:hypothetical protein